MLHQYSVSTVCEKIKNEGKKTKITPRLEADTGLCHCLVLHVCHIHAIMGPEGPVPRENCEHSSTLSTYYSVPTGFHDFFLSCIYFSMPCIILIELGYLVCIFEG